MSKVSSERGYQNATSVLYGHLLIVLTPKRSDSHN